MKGAQLAVDLLRRLPKNAISRVAGKASEVSLPRPLQQVLNNSFVRLAGIDAGEAARSPGEYASLNAVFTRRLRADARELESTAPEALISPVDGRVGAYGGIEEGTLFQAKGRDYQLVDLVDSAREQQHFQGGSYLTIYLSPQNYHRIHSPTTGRVDGIGYIPGHLFPVNPCAVAHIDNLFAVNERLITYLETPKLGRVAVVKVGATCVGRISLTFHPMHTNRGLRRRREFELQDDLALAHGEEMAVFNLGSTVIVLVESPAFSFHDRVQSGRALQMGQVVGQI